MRQRSFQPLPTTADYNCVSQALKTNDRHTVYRYWAAGYDVTLDGAAVFILTRLSATPMLKFLTHELGLPPVVASSQNAAAVQKLAVELQKSSVSLEFAQAMLQAFANSADRDVERQFLERFLCQRWMSWSAGFSEIFGAALWMVAKADAGGEWQIPWLIRFADIHQPQFSSMEVYHQKLRDSLRPFCCSAIDFDSAASATPYGGVQKLVQRLRQLSRIVQQFDPVRQTLLLKAAAADFFHLSDCRHCFQDFKNPTLVFTKVFETFTQPSLFQDVSPLLQQPAVLRMIDDGLITDCRELLTTPRPQRKSFAV